ncbi:hypothetical protein [Muriicola marianensis]|uniref:Nicotinate-nucleotide adenylyltransferase n=1 Tax=Muriicola marianensis TaxID=1324801 RepID=A0ABQ1QVS7_9FLAO|nr:hypothetical protein [Muriicola marianensis]GGD46367.1 hypothetical protein GCM10011361_11640 [Muriicola marianensis]
MKQILFSALLLGLSGTGLAQDAKPQVQEISLAAVTVSPILNHSYRNMAIKGINSEAVVDLEEIAARYNVNESSVYDKSMDAYEIIFKNSKGSILATYDKTGKILTTVERYKDISLPSGVRNTVHSQYPGWELTDNNYLVRFKDGRDIRRVFTVTIVKDGAKKNLKLSVEGESMG